MLGRQARSFCTIPGVQRRILNGVTSFGSCEVNGFNALYSSWLGSGSPTLPSKSSVSC